MFPSHPHAAAWHDTALKYMMNTLCTESDTQRPATPSTARRWISGFKAANLYPDYTLENHKHLSSVLRRLQFIFSDAGGPVLHLRRPPDTRRGQPSSSGHVAHVSIDHPPLGEAAYPQGMDSGAARTVHSWTLYASAGGASERLVRFSHGAVQSAVDSHLAANGKRQPGVSRLAAAGSLRHAINAELAAYGLLAHKVFGPAASR